MNYEWMSDCPGADFGGTETSPTPTLCLGAGGCPTQCSVSLTIREGVLRSATCSSDVVVRDTTPPAVEAGADDLRCLWPPNHRYVCYGREALAAKVDDLCGGVVAWRFSGCASDQPDDADESDPKSPWGGDGHTTEDCVIRQDGNELCVRAERAGTGPGADGGRRYEVSVVAVDDCGNESLPTAVGRIRVPHDLSGEPPGCDAASSPGGGSAGVRLRLPRR
jgi:hypothetical protein